MSIQKIKKGDIILYPYIELINVSRVEEQDDAYHIRYLDSGESNIYSIDEIMSLLKMIKPLAADNAGEIRIKRKINDNPDNLFIEKIHPYGVISKFGNGNTNSIQKGKINVYWKNLPETPFDNNVSNSQENKNLNPENFKFITQPLIGRKSKKRLSKKNLINKKKKKKLNKKKLKKKKNKTKTK